MKIENIMGKGREECFRRVSNESWKISNNKG